MTVAEYRKNLAARFNTRRFDLCVLFQKSEQNDPDEYHDYQPYDHKVTRSGGGFSDK